MSLFLLQKNKTDFVEGCWKGMSQGISSKSGHLIPFLFFLIATLWKLKSAEKPVLSSLSNTTPQTDDWGLTQKKAFCQGKSTEVRHLPLPGKGTGIQPNPGIINSWSGSAHALSSSITWALQMENSFNQVVLREVFQFIQQSQPFAVLVTLWEGMSPSAEQIPGGSSGLHWAGGGSWWPKVVPVSLTPTFSKYFRLWSDPGNWNCSFPEADLADKFLTSL